MPRHYPGVKITQTNVTRRPSASHTMPGQYDLIPVGIPDFYHDSLTVDQAFSFASSDYLSFFQFLAVRLKQGLFLINAPGTLNLHYHLDLNKPGLTLGIEDTAFNKILKTYYQRTKTVYYSSGNVSRDAALLSKDFQARSVAVGERSPTLTDYPISNLFVVPMQADFGQPAGFADEAIIKAAFGFSPSANLLAGASEWLKKHIGESALVNTLYSPVSLAGLGGGLAIVALIAFGLFSINKR